MLCALLGLIFMDEKPEIYVEHGGTIRISGRTLPHKAGFCAFSYLQQGMAVIDFFYIGGNAGQQAAKSMGVFSHLVKQDMALKNKNVFVAFVPLRFMTMAKDAGIGNPREKDASVWRVVLVDGIHPSAVKDGDLPVKNDRSEHEHSDP